MQKEFTDFGVKFMSENSRSFKENTGMSNLQHIYITDPNSPVFRFIGSYLILDKYWMGELTTLSPSELSALKLFLEQL